MKFLPNFEGFRLAPFFAPIFLTKDVLYLLSHISIWSICVSHTTLKQYNKKRVFRQAIFPAFPEIGVSFFAELRRPPLPCNQ